MVSKMKWAQERIVEAVKDNYSEEGFTFELDLEDTSSHILDIAIMDANEELSDGDWDCRVRIKAQNIDGTILFEGVIEE